MQVNRISNQSFGKAYLTQKALFRTSEEQFDLFVSAMNKLEKKPNSLIFDIGKDKTLIAKAYNSANKLLKTFENVTKENLQEAIDFCINLPKEKQFQKKYPVSFETFLNKYCGCELY